MLKHQMQKRYTELSSRFEGGKEKEEISETKRTWFRPMRTERERERGGCEEDASWRRLGLYQSLMGRCR